MLRKNIKILTMIAAIIASTTNIATSTVNATTTSSIQAKLPPGYGLDEGKVTKELLEIKLISVKNDVETGNTANLAKNVAKLKSYLQEAIDNKEANQEEAKKIMKSENKAN